MAAEARRAEEAKKRVEAEKAKRYEKGLIKTFKKGDYQTGTTHRSHVVDKVAKLHGLSVSDMKKAPKVRRCRLTSC